MIWAIYALLLFALEKRNREEQNNRPVKSVYYDKRDAHHFGLHFKSSLRPVPPPPPAYPSSLMPLPDTPAHLPTSATVSGQLEELANKIYVGQEI